MAEANAPLYTGKCSTPATRDRPRIVTPEAIEAFERANPALKGIGTIMMDLGIWIVENREKTANKDSRKVSAKTYLSDTARNCNELYAGEIY